MADPTLTPIDPLFVDGGFNPFDDPGLSQWPGYFNAPGPETYYNAPDPTPPAYDQIDEVIVETPRAAPPKETFVAPPIVVPPTWLAPAVEVASGVGAAIASGIGAVVGFLMPVPTAPRDLDEAPEPLMIDVTGARTPRPPSVLPPFDTPMPPNWEDLLHGYNFLWDTFGFPFPEFGDELDRAPRERRSPRLPRTPRSNPDLPELDEFTVTARPARPRPIADPAPYIFGDAFEGSPFGLPGDMPYLEPEPLAQPDRRARPLRDTEIVDAPFLFSNPALDPLPGYTPFADPDTAPAPKLDVPPRVDVRVPGDLLPFSPSSPTLPRAPTFTDLDPSLAPEPDEKLAPPPKGADTCACAKPKKKKPKKPRTRCFKGTYTETSKSLKKSPKEWVDCETGKPVGSERA